MESKKKNISVDSWRPILDTQIKQAASNYTTLIAQLEAIKKVDCADSQGAFKQSLQTARQQLQTFNNNLKTIRTTFQAKVMVDLRALKDQKPISRPGPSNSPSTNP